MSVPSSPRIRTAPIETPNGAAALVRSWRSYYGGNALQRALTRAPKQHVLATQYSTGNKLQFRPTEFSFRDVVVLKLAESDELLRVGLFDLAAGNFLPVIVDLFNDQRRQLGFGGGTTRRFLEVLLASVRANIAANPSDPSPHPARLI